MRTGDLLQLWWCGNDDNPSDHTQISDSIQYESFNLVTREHEGPYAVLGETQYAWDSSFLCNPRVVRGHFVNPLGNGATYTYALYYVAEGAVGNNSIGVAFSGDGKTWKKFPHPIISPEVKTGYGVAQPAVVNVDQHSNIRMFYEDDSYSVQHVEASSSDGVHFTVLGTLTTNGLDTDNPQASWGDMAYDPQTNHWYAAFQFSFRDPSTTGGSGERGQYGIELYRIADAALLTGPWEMLTTIDTNLTGYESNFIPSLLRRWVRQFECWSLSRDPVVHVHLQPAAPLERDPLASGTVGEHYHLGYRIRYVGAQPASKSAQPVCQPGRA